MARGAGGGRGDGLPAGAELLALPPDRFTKERDALASRLAEGGDARGAAEVRRLRRPVGLAWVLNRLAQARPDALAALLEAGDRLRAGQRRAMAGGGAAALREAEEELRGAARALRLEARSLLEETGRAADPAALGRVELLLRVAATATGEAREALRLGVLAREPEPAAGELSGLGLLPGDATGAAEPSPRAGRRAEEKADRAARAAAAREARRTARELAAARERLARAEQAARSARRAAEAARRQAEELRGRAERAEQEAADRRRALEALLRGE